MTLPWSAQQIEWLAEMGFEVLARRGAAGQGAEASGESSVDGRAQGARADGAVGPARVAQAGGSPAPKTAPGMNPPPARENPGNTPQQRDRADPARSAIAPMLARAARGVDLAPLLADGPPRDPATRRALWRALRPLRKAARAR